MSAQVAVISFRHGACMRSISLAKPVLVAALGCMVLSGCGTHNATTGETHAGSALSTTSPLEAPLDDPETRFLALITRITLSCDPDAPKNKGEVPQPEDLPGWEDAPPPRYGLGQTPPGDPDSDGDIPVPLPSDAPRPPESTPSAAKPEPLPEMPLTGIDKCSGRKHAKRVTEAFQNTKTTSYQTMHTKLMGLDYPASRIRRMPSHAGVLRARVDLRFIGSNLALEVTATSNRVIAEAFGVPETEDVKLSDVKRKPRPNARTS